jgi:hypothetical protein
MEESDDVKIFDRADDLQKMSVSLTEDLTSFGISSE